MEDEDTGGYSTYHVGIFLQANPLRYLLSLSLSLSISILKRQVVIVLVRFFVFVVSLFWHVDTACVPLVTFLVTTHFSSTTQLPP